MSKIKRYIAFMLVTVILSVNIQVHPAHAAVPIVAGGIAITPEVVAYVGGLMAAAGVVFYSETELTDAVISFAKTKEESFTEVMKPYTAWYYPNGLGSDPEPPKDAEGKLAPIPLDLETLKKSYGYIKDFYKT